ncbi:hypothetical protein N7517_008034 [Penicillium concentricum]|uniref:DUF6604 domain-containing protein n=1 Tax=Penicillium concentricum TaxID=293559 RepID=A0A9W9RRM1_9EURO|nr:uncharacterized protein N7517_008034 [Penicillium concentricum]KAJ5365148.1 hypothetical protein N7517_008034 [Penicillium concentricum]
MLTDFLTSQYLQYKTDTDIADGPGKKAKPTGRLKGKARKAAKAPPKSTPTNDSIHKQKYTIAVKQFTPFAEHIARYNNKPPIGPMEVSRSFSLALDNEATQESHGFLVEVLERVRETLPPLMPKRQADTSGFGKEEKSLANRFENLELEEQLEAFLNAPDASKPAVPETTTGPSTTDMKAKADLEAEMAPERRDIMFMFHLLSQDANTSRDIIENTWKGYKEGVWDLVSASITTNTAIDLLRRMEEEMKPALDKPGSGEKLLEASYIARCKQLSDPHYEESPGDGFNLKIYSQTQDLLILPWRLLRDFTTTAATCDMHNPPTYEPATYGIYDPESDPETKSARERFVEDKQILGEAFPEFYILALHTTENFAEDELTRGLKLAFCNKEHPFWLVFAVQVHEKRLRRPIGVAFRLFQWHPVFCGLLLYSLKMLYQEAGTTFVGAWGCVLYPLHLYNALRQERLVTARWADLDVLQAIQRHSWIGAPPQTPDDYIKRFCLSMGYSATNFAKNRRNGRPRALKNGPKGLTEKGSVGLMLKQRFCYGSR